MNIVLCMTADKFNCTVPGTLPTNTSQCPLRIFSEIKTSSLNNTHQHTSTISLTNITSSPPTSSTEISNDNQPHFQLDSPLFYIVVIIVGGASCVLGASFVLCVQHGRECTRM